MEIFGSKLVTKNLICNDLIQKSKVLLGVVTKSSPGQSGPIQEIFLGAWDGRYGLENSGLGRVGSDGPWKCRDWGDKNLAPQGSRAGKTRDSRTA